MKISYTESFENVIKANIVFDGLSKEPKRYLFFRAIFISVFLLVLFLYNSYKEGFSIDGVKYPLGSLICSSVWAIPISLLIGWVIYKFSLVKRENSLKSYYEGLPKDYYGYTIIDLENEGIIVDKPYHQIKYLWKSITSVKEAGDFLFLCLNEKFVLVIPLEAIGGQKLEFLEKINNYINSHKKDAVNVTQS